MVDAAVSFDRNDLSEPVASQPATSQSRSARAVSVSDRADLAAYIAFCDEALFAPAQSPEWISRWTANVRPDTLVATLSIDGKAALSLALEVMRFRGMRIARFMGGRHANGNFAAADRSWLEKADAGDLAALTAAIGKARPDIDLVALERLLPEMDGMPNPLAMLSNFPSPNLSLAVDLDGGFDALLARASGKRKRKKHRSQIRKFEAVGPYRRIEARTPEETRAFLDAFFIMKEQRFRKMGVTDVFGDARVRGFFHALFAGALERRPPNFVLHGLEVAGKLRAVTGSSVSGRRLICEFGAIAEDELGHASPGDFLFFDNIQEACENGFAIYDFSVGDEPYKRLWCDLEMRHFDVLVPLTLKGRLMALCLRRVARLKSFIKTSPAIWRLTKLLRRKAAAHAATPAEDD